MSKIKTSSIPLEDLKPCAVCSGKSGKIMPIFLVVEIKHAVINVREVNRTLGLAQFFGGGNAGLELARVMGSQSEAAAVLENPETVVRLFICNDCYCTKDYNLAELAERDAEATKRKTESELIERPWAASMQTLRERLAVGEA